MPSPSLPRHLLVAAPLMLLTAAALAACGGSADGAGSAAAVAVTADDDSCTVADTELAAGDTTFEVTNEGSKVTEVYVYGESGGTFTKVVSEVENIGPGTSRDLDVDLAAGDYEIACKPGQKGDGIRQAITVTGEGGSSAAADEGYDRELELTVDGSGLTGLEPATANQGERIEFKLENSTDGTRTLEILAPAGDVAAEFDVPAGDEGEAVVELADTGDWTVKVEGGSADIEQTMTVR
jgi:iron uptake system component EfeO